jgi:hypothetical protein
MAELEGGLRFGYEPGPRRRGVGADTAHDGCGRLGRPSGERKERQPDPIPLRPSRLSQATSNTLRLHQPIV